MRKRMDTAGRRQAVSIVHAARVAEELAVNERKTRGERGSSFPMILSVILEGISATWPNVRVLSDVRGAQLLLFARRAESGHFLPWLFPRPRSILTLLKNLVGWLEVLGREAGDPAAALHFRRLRRWLVRREKFIHSVCQLREGCDDRTALVEAMLLEFAGL